MAHDLFVKYLSVSFGSFILCKIQEQVSLVVIGQWIVLNLRLKKYGRSHWFVDDILFCCYYYLLFMVLSRSLYLY